MIRLARLSIAVGVFGVPAFAQTNLIVNGTFDAPDVSGAFETINSDNVPPTLGWVVVSDDRPEPAATTGKLGVDLINGLWRGVGATCNPDGNDQSVDIDGATMISQTFPTQVGQAYLVELYYSHNFSAAAASGDITVEGNTVLVSASLQHASPNGPVNMAWLRFSRCFVADSTATTLTIAGETDNLSFGFAIDSVFVGLADPTLAAPAVLATTPAAQMGGALSGPSVDSIAVIFDLPVSFADADVTVLGGDGQVVSLATLGSESQIMTISLTTPLLGDTYTVTISDAVTSVATGETLDGDNDGVAGGDYVFSVTHKCDEDVDGSGAVDLSDLAVLLAAFGASCN